MLPKELWDCLPQLYIEAVSGKPQEGSTGKSVYAGREAMWIGYEEPRKCKREGGGTVFTPEVLGFVPSLNF